MIWTHCGDKAVLMLMIKCCLFLILQLSNHHPLISGSGPPGAWVGSGERVEKGKRHMVVGERVKGRGETF